MARGIHGFPKVSPGPAMRATPETALQPFLGWSIQRAGDLRLSSTPFDTPCCTRLLKDVIFVVKIGNVSLQP
jgi:hypothetical protein